MSFTLRRGSRYGIGFSWGLQCQCFQRKSCSSNWNIGSAEPDGRAYMSTSDDERKKALMARGLPKRKNIEGVKSVVLVASGKGGVGKSTIAVNLAVRLALAHPDKKIGLLDADVFGPSLPLMMNLNGKPETNSKNLMIPLQNYGVKCMSMGFLLDEKDPVVWRGLMVMQAIENLLRGVAWDPCDLLLIDMPPGTGDTQLSIAQTVVVDGAIMVTTPQKVALQDALKGAEMFKKTAVPILGFVINMSSFLCPSCGESTPLLATKNTEDILAKYPEGSGILGKLPFTAEVSETSDDGKPIVISNPTSVHAREFRKIGAIIMGNLEASAASSKKGNKYWRVFNSAFGASEYDGWRGKAYLDDMDMVEIANWVKELNATQIDEALKYYWVNNEVMYCYGAIVRGMFAAFAESTKGKNLSRPFLLGVEIVIHYIILKSFPVVGRQGGIRGTGQDKIILRPAVAPLIACYNKIAPTQNFSVAVFPIMQRRKKRRVILSSRRRHNARIGIERHRQRRSTLGEITEKLTVQVNDIAPTPRTMTPNEGDDDADADNVLEIDRDSLDRRALGRYSYTLSHGSQMKSKKTNIVLADDDINKLENIAVTIFWLIYELLPSLCQWTTAQITPFKEAFDKIVGLVVSMYLYDTADFAEEYERIFNLTLNQYEAEWVKMEVLAKSLQKEKKLNLTKPYSNVL